MNICFFLLVFQGNDKLNIWNVWHEMIKIWSKLNVKKKWRKVSKLYVESIHFELHKREIWRKERDREREKKGGEQGREKKTRKLSYEAIQTKKQTCEAVANSSINCVFENNYKNVKRNRNAMQWELEGENIGLLLSAIELFVCSRSSHFNNTIEA